MRAAALPLLVVGECTRPGLNKGLGLLLCDRGDIQKKKDILFLTYTDMRV